MQTVNPATGVISAQEAEYADCKVVNDELLECTIPELKPGQHVCETQYALRSTTGTGLRQGWTRA